MDDPVAQRPEQSSLKRTVEGSTPSGISNFMSVPTIAIIDPNGGDKNTTISLVSGLAFGTHTVMLAISDANGMIHHHGMTFLGTGCDLNFQGKLGTKIKAQVDGAIIHEFTITTVFHQRLFRLVQKLIKESPTKIPYIM